MAADENLITGR